MPGSSLSAVTGSSTTPSPSWPRWGHRQTCCRAQDDHKNVWGTQGRKLWSEADERAVEFLLEAAPRLWVHPGGNQRGGCGSQHLAAFRNAFRPEKLTPNRPPGPPQATFLAAGYPGPEQGHVAHATSCCLQAPCSLPNERLQGRLLGPPS